MATTYSIGSVAEVISGKKSPKKTPMKLQEIKEVEKTATDEATPKKNKRRSKAEIFGTPSADTNVEQNTPKQLGSLKKEKIKENGEIVMKEATPKMNKRRSNRASLGTPMADTNIEQNTPKQLGSLKKIKIKENGENVTEEATPKKRRSRGASLGAPTNVGQNTPKQPESLKKQKVKENGETVMEEATPRKRSRGASLGASTSVEQNTPKQPGSLKKQNIKENNETVTEEATPKKRRSRGVSLGAPTNIEQNTPKQLGSLKKQKIEENSETVMDEATPNKTKRRRSRGTPKADTSVQQNTPEQPVSLKKKKRKSTDLTAATPEVSPKKAKSPAVTEADKESEEVEKRSIFVGNVPKDVNMDKLRTLFSKYGEVQSCRMRGITPVDPNISKRVAAITKQTNRNRDSVQCYVVFKDEQDAVKALAANGQEFSGHHLCVNLAKKQPHNPERAVFIGNMPFKVEEEDIWKVFEGCGKIASVRVVRDNFTGIGKGFGYVNFESADGVELALQMEDIVINDRTLRLKRCVSSDGKKGRKRTFPFTVSKKTKAKRRAPAAQAAQVAGPKADAATFQGAKFSDKKRRARPNKDTLRKKKLGKMLAPRKKVQ